MQITRQADYAVRAVLCLAQRAPGAQMATARIAEVTKVPAAFLAKIVAQLAAAGLLRAWRGARGGVALARPASTISLLEVVEAIDGPLTLNVCTEDPTACELCDTCTVQAVWAEARDDLRQRLGNLSFADLAVALLVEPAAVEAPLRAASAG